jgi:hypothetical protein
VFKEKSVSVCDKKTESCWSFDAMMPNLKPQMYQTHNLSKKSLSKTCSYEGVVSKAATLFCQYEVWCNDGNLLKSGLKLWRESCAEVQKGKKSKELNEHEGLFFPAFQQASPQARAGYFLLFYLIQISVVFIQKYDGADSSFL